MQTVKLNKDFPIICFLILAMCVSMELYFTWKLPESIVNLMCAVVFFLSYFRKVRITIYSLLLIAFVVICYVYNYVHTIAFSFVSFVNLFSLIIITSFYLLTSVDFKLKLLYSFDFFLKCLCCVSLIGWLLYLVGVPLPHYYSDTSDFYSHEVYYLFVITNSSIWDIIPRFSGMFLEPGHIGSTACLCLYIHRFNFRIKSNYIYLLAILFSLSLAAYVLLFIGICIYYFFNGKHVVWSLFVLSFFTVIFVSIGLNYNDGNNIINERILSRLVFEDGQLSGDNRTSMLFDSYYEEWLREGNVIFGYGQKAYGYDGSTNILLGCASFKRFFFVNGVIGVLLVLILYFILFRKYPSKQGWGFFALYILCNMIRDYPYRLMWFYLFIGGVVSLCISEKKYSFVEVGNY